MPDLNDEIEVEVTFEPVDDFAEMFRAIIETDARQDIASEKRLAEQEEDDAYEG